MVEAPPVGVPRLPGFPAAVASPAKASQPAPANHPWQQVVQWMEQDPRTQPVDPLPGGNEPAAAFLANWLPWGREHSAGRDPFFPPELAEAARVEEEVEPPESTPPPVVRPEDMGASVSAVVVGPDGGTAILNGRAYRKGEQMTFEKDGRAYVFTLAEIQHGGVVLTRDDMRYVLPMPRSSDAPKLSSGEIELPVPHALP